MSKPWGGLGRGPIGSWAAEAELAEAEAEERAMATATNLQSFPSLKEAVTAKPKKKKMTLSEFNTLSAGSSFGSTRLTPDEMLQLPTAPKPRSSDDYAGGPRLGGGFSNYGDDRRSRRGGFEDDRRGPSRREFEVQPSRADEVDDWASSKRTMPPPDSGRSSGDSRYGSLGGGSRADEVDSWNMGKRAVQAPPPTARPSSFGSGFRDSGSGWRRERESEGDMGRPRLVLDPPTNKPNPFGVARPREEVLAAKGFDLMKLDEEIEEKKAASISGSRPTSSRLTSAQSDRSESVGGEALVGQRPKVNPFGDARPREVLLEEKGMNWRKIDLELESRRVERPETDEEKALKEEIENLKKELEKESSNDASQGSGSEQTDLRDLIRMKENDLEALIREVNDKVRFGQKAAERPGSGAGRFTGFPNKPHSRSGSFEDSRGMESIDRPRSHDKGDTWRGPGDDRRGGFLDSRDRAFVNNRDSDRSRTGERW